MTMPPAQRRAVLAALFEADRRRRVIIFWATVAVAMILGIVVALVAISLDGDPSQDCRDAGGVPLTTADDKVACLDPDAVKFGAR